MRGLAPGMAAAVLAVAATAAQAQSAPDHDLDRIPTAPGAGEPIPDLGPAPNPARTLYLEDAVSGAGARGGLLVPPPPGPTSSWQELLFLDVRTTKPLTPQLSVTLGARANLRLQEDIDFPDQENVRLDLREAYLSWQPRDGIFVDAGRINLKSGVALGYNPTDFFKTRAVVQVLSSDPSVLREDRLGAVMIRTQAVLPQIAVTLAYAPRLYDPTPVYSDLKMPSLDPMLDRTNAADRILVKASLKLADDFSPEILVYSAGGRARLGLNLTESLGRSTVIYGEWAGGRQQNLISAALAYGRFTGAIPRTAPPVLPVDGGERFRSNLSLGASYTTASKIVFNLEYHYHEAGFSSDDWRRWFAAGEAGRAHPGVAAQLWYIRSYAADQQEPLSRHTAFLRVDRQDAFVRNLELSGFVSADLQDRSGAAQVEAQYFLSDRVTVGGLVFGTFGARHSDFGSGPGAVSALVKLARYF
jgi:hypothetical protein